MSDIIQITQEQQRFIFSDAKYAGFIGGFGSGKTEATINKAYVCASEAGRDGNILLAEPTRQLILDILWPKMQNKLAYKRIHFDTNKQELRIKPTFIYTKASKGHVRRHANIATFDFRSYENPERIIGVEYHAAFLDELDTINVEKATNVWRKVLGRMRQKPKTYVKKTNIPPRSISVSTTPEGFMFAYKLWGDPNIKLFDERNGLMVKMFERIQASSRNNPWLDKDYVANMLSQYPANLVAAYIDGYFVNLAQGSVYPNFCRHKNGTKAELEHDDLLHIGMDFNITKMTATFWVNRAKLGNIYCVDEIVNEFDTASMCDAIIAKFGKDVVRRSIVYPDASGASRKTSAGGKSDIDIIRSYGFRVIVDPVNPSVRDRVNSVNWRIMDGSGVRRLFVNTDRCPTLTKCLEQQAYKDGAPDKTSGLDHSPETAGYVIHKLYPFIPHTQKRIIQYAA